MELVIEAVREADGAWIAEVADLPGVVASGASCDEAIAKAEVLALRVLAEKIERETSAPEPISILISIGFARRENILQWLRLFRESRGG